MIAKPCGSFRRFILLGVFTLLSMLGGTREAYALITLDATTPVSGSGASITVAHTVAADATGLVVAVKFWDCSGGTVSVSGMTYAGAALTQANRDTSASGGCGNHAEIWYKASPAIGTNNLVITFSAATGGVGGAAVSLKGFKQTSQPDAIADSADHAWCSNPDSTNITIVSANSWIFDAAQSGSGFGAPSSGQTQLSSITSYKPNVSAGTTSMGWAYTGCASGSHALAAFAPDTGGGGATYVVSEGRFTGGGGDATSINYQLTESSFESFSSVPLTSINYAAEGKVGIGGAGIGTINSVTPADFTKYFHDQSASYVVSATSQDGDTLQYKASQDATVKAGPQASGTLGWTFSAADIGRHTVSLEVIDPQGTTLKKQEVYVVRRPTK